MRFILAIAVLVAAVYVVNANVLRPDNDAEQKSLVASNPFEAKLVEDQTLMQEKSLAKESELSRTKRGAKGRKQKNKKAKKNRRRKNRKAKKNRRRKNRKAKKNRRRKNRKARRNRRRKNRKARKNRRRKNRKARRNRRRKNRKARRGRKGRKGRKGKKGQLVDYYESDSGSSNGSSSNSASSSSSQGSNGSSKRRIPYCPPGYYKKLAAKSSKKKCGKRAAKVIAKAFGRLFCIYRRRYYRKTSKTLTRKKFLIRYFKKYQTKNNYLPRRALRKYLRQSLPKKDKLRKKLLALRTRCVKKLKRRIDRNNDFKVSRKEFIRYFRPILKKVKCKKY